jgi:hypothetical protein
MKILKSYCLTEKLVLAPDDDCKFRDLAKDLALTEENNSQ